MKDRTYMFIRVLMVYNSAKPMYPRQRSKCSYIKEKDHLYGYTHDIISLTLKIKISMKVLNVDSIIKTVTIK